MYTIAHTNHHTPIDSSSGEDVWVVPYVASDGDSSDEGTAFRLPIRKAVPHLAASHISQPYISQPYPPGISSSQPYQPAIYRQNRLPRALQCLLPFNKAGIKEAAL
jgi:hypothetical protein